MKKIIGTINKLDIGIGTWALIGEDGVIYELRDLPKEFKQTGLRASVQGEILLDAMSMAMIGPIFAVTEVTRLD